VALKDRECGGFYKKNPPLRQGKYKPAPAEGLLISVNNDVPPDGR
jgi:hypothetical protein